MGSHSKSRLWHQESSLNTGGFILDFVVDSSAQYNILAKEEKDPKGPYTIKFNQVPKQQTKSLHALKLHWSLQKSTSY